MTKDPREIYVWDALTTLEIENVLPMFINSIRSAAGKSNAGYGIVKVLYDCFDKGVPLEIAINRVRATIIKTSEVRLANKVK